MTKPLEKTMKPDVNVEKAKAVLAVVDKGLSMGVGDPKPGQMCVEAAVAYAYGEPHGDEPKCVDASLRNIKIQLNDDGAWKNSKDRARGMRRLAIAQLGSLSLFDESDFWYHINVQLLPYMKANLIAKINKVDHPDDFAGMLEDEWGNLQYTEITDMEGLMDFCNEILEPKNANKASHRVAEIMVQALIKMKLPGTKYLYLTEKADSASAKPVAKKKKTKK